MDSEENKDLEIVMGGDSDIEISEVGDIMNDLKPNTSKEKKSIIIPISMNKSQNSNTEDDKEDDDKNSDNDSDEKSDETEKEEE